MAGTTTTPPDTVECVNPCGDRGCRIGVAMPQRRLGRSGCGMCENWTTPIPVGFTVDLPHSHDWDAGSIVHAWHSHSWAMHMFEIEAREHHSKYAFAPGGGRQGGRNWCRCDQCTYADNGVNSIRITRRRMIDSSPEHGWLKTPEANWTPAESTFSIERQTSFIFIPIRPMISSVGGLLCCQN